MSRNIKELRTINKNLLIGMIAEKDGVLCLVVKNRGKEDYISMKILLKIMNAIMETCSDDN